MSYPVVLKDSFYRIEPFPNKFNVVIVIPGKEDSDEMVIVNPLTMNSYVFLKDTFYNGMKASYICEVDYSDNSN